MTKKPNFGPGHVAPLGGEVIIGPYRAQIGGTVPATPARSHFVTSVTAALRSVPMGIMGEVLGEALVGICREPEVVEQIGNEIGRAGHIAGRIAK